MPITLPTGLVSIYANAADECRFKLVYSAGWLWDTDETGEITRRATLSEEDREWMEEQFGTLVLSPKNVL
ncbi:MAG: hypothetical protein AAGA03_04155 [Planctomycetota bacterium]